MELFLQFTPRAAHVTATLGDFAPFNHEGVVPHKGDIVSLMFLPSQAREEFVCLSRHWDLCHSRAHATLFVLLDLLQ